MVLWLVLRLESVNKIVYFCFLFILIGYLVFYFLLIISCKEGCFMFSFILGIIIMIMCNRFGKLNIFKFFYF